MTQRTSDPASIINGTLCEIYGEFNPRIFRADGSVEDRGWIRNQLTAKGLNRIARRAVDHNTTSAALYIGVGTRTTASSLDTAVTSFGELSRKLSLVGSTAATSREWFFMVATWGGQSDGLTGVLLDSAAILDHASSGNGAAWNIVNALGVTLQQSDVLNLTARIRVGSHDIDNS